jgi:hypothetical protein
MADDPLDERFVIEGDPEEALRGILKTPQRLYEVVMSERRQDADYSGDAPTDTAALSPYVHTKIWTGNAASDGDAHDKAWASWRAEYGEPTGQTATEVKSP